MLVLLVKSVSLFWIVYAWLEYYHRSERVWLKNQEPLGPKGYQNDVAPRVALIFAARNEAENIEKSVRTILRLEYPNLVFVGVNDRSTDQTPNILNQLANEDDRLQVLHLSSLENGWLGKTAALHQAFVKLESEAQKPDWYLFTDADVEFSPSVLEKAVSLIQKKNLDHLTAFPEIPFVSFWERVFFTFFQLAFSMRFPAYRVPIKKSKVFNGVGAFNMISAKALRAVNGFSLIRLSVDEDMRMGQLLKWSGFECLSVAGQGAIKVRWQKDFKGFVFGLEKNFFGSLDFNPWFAISSAFGILLVGFAPWVALFTGFWGFVCGFGALLALTLVMRANAEQNGFGGLYGLTLPLGSILFCFIDFWSMLQTYRRNGIVWREHHYPLAELRAHVRKRNLKMRRVWKQSNHF